MNGSIRASRARRQAAGCSRLRLCLWTAFLVTAVATHELVAVDGAQWPEVAETSSLRRQLYDVASTGTDCENCQRRGKTTCWGRRPDVEGGGGDWDRTYCCSGSDTFCRRLTYCSDRVTAPVLRAFTCPMDKYRCPWGEEADLRLNNLNTKAALQSRGKTWDRFLIRRDTFCKLHVELERPTAEQLRQ